MRGEETIKKSLRLLQQEELLIITKELEFIGNILDYFYGYEQERENPSKKNIQKLRYDIDVLYGRIENLRQLSSYHTAKSRVDLEFILIYDYIRIEIEEMLSTIEALYTKMNQLFGEMLNQYLPYPTFFGRRYSSNELMIFLDNLFQDINFQIYQKGSDSNRIVLGWSYNSEFRYKILRNREIKRTNYTYTNLSDYIELPYWYYELPLLIPAITHELISLPIKKRRSYYRYKDAYEEFRALLRTFFEDHSNYLVQEIGDILGYEWIINELSTDIFADMAAYRLHGPSYLYTLFHNLLGEGTARDFLEIIYEREAPREGMGAHKIQSYSLRPNDWFFSSKREHNLLRIQLLLSLHEEKLQTPQERELHAQMQRAVDLIMPLASDHSPPGGFEELFRTNFPNYYSTYSVVQNYLSQLYETIITSDIPNHIDLDYDETILAIFNRLWDQRFHLFERHPHHDMVPHKGEFRRLIHRYVSKIDYLQSNPPKTQVLILRKVRKDYCNKLPSHTAICHDFLATLQEHFLSGAPTSWVAYGIYDFAYLHPRANNIDLQEEFAQVAKAQEKRLFYFDSKIVLMEIAPPIVGSGDGPFNLIANVELEKSHYISGVSPRSLMSGYKDLPGAIQEIAAILHSHSPKFHRATIYKSLGPKDLTIVIEGSRVSDFYQIIDTILEKAPQVNRTFSIFTTSTMGGSLEQEEGITLRSYLRLAKKSRVNQEQIFQTIAEYGELHETTGVMDLVIYWRQLPSLEALFHCYKELMGYITDYQTKIDRRLC
ncbi:MAG: hypothetical protein C6I00_01195 [Nitratiruptor sp.]|nr:hypothetical protein [Nitratiruptor sp.]NPA83211.1 hypothetical protein [Campylobacterota bacterium]